MKALWPRGVKKCCMMAVTRAERESCDRNTGVSNKNGLSPKNIPLHLWLCRTAHIVLSIWTASILALIDPFFLFSVFILKLESTNLQYVQKIKWRGKKLWLHVLVEGGNDEKRRGHCSIAVFSTACYIKTVKLVNHQHDVTLTYNHSYIEFKGTSAFGSNDLDLIKQIWWCGKIIWNV